MRRILLVNPPVFDFGAHDFWMRPYGLLQVAGYLRNQADLVLFDCLDRRHPFLQGRSDLRSDEWGRGKLPFEYVGKPPVFEGIPRYFRRFGLPRGLFREFLEERGPFDAVLIQTGMTYWYPGVREVLEDVRLHCPEAVTVLGGTYATLCPGHARRLGADVVITGSDLRPLRESLGFEPDLEGLPFWEGYERGGEVGVMKLADGCPFRCSYCAIQTTGGHFQSRPLERVRAEFERLMDLGFHRIAFYDDALLFQPERVLMPFLEAVLQSGRGPQFHTPNALHARFLTPELAALMIRAGFTSFYLGFESGSKEWQRTSGAKVSRGELARAVEILRHAGADPRSITAYLLLGHPRGDEQDLEASMRYVHSLGIRIMLAEFSPNPGTPDGEICRQWIDLEEPLNHNKIAFPIRLLGFGEFQRFKGLCRELNRGLRR